MCVADDFVCFCFIYHLSWFKLWLCFILKLHPPVSCLTFHFLLQFSRPFLSSPVYHQLITPCVFKSSSSSLFVSLLFWFPLMYPHTFPILWHMFLFLCSLFFKLFWVHTLLFCICSWISWVLLSACCFFYFWIVSIWEVFLIIIIIIKPTCGLVLVCLGALLFGSLVFKSWHKFEINTVIQKKI